MGDGIVARIQSLLDEVGEEQGFDIVQAYLFGSRARGDHDETSDVDVVVVSPDFADDPVHLRAKPFYLAWSYPPDLEVKCYTVEEFERLTESASIARTARDEGIAVA